jgi:hypothetical protein
MASVVIAGDTSGTVTLQAPAVAGSTTLTLPATTGTVALTADIPAATGLVYIGSGVGDGTTGVSFTSIPSYSALLLKIDGSNSATGALSLRVELSSNNGSSYGATRQITSSDATTQAPYIPPIVGMVHISNTSAASTNKTITPATVNCDTTYATVATETVITGVINALRVTSSGASAFYAVTVFGIQA